MSDGISDAYKSYKSHNLYNDIFEEILSNRYNIYREIDKEREYQNSINKTTNDFNLSINEWKVRINKYLDKSNNSQSPHHQRKNLVKSASIIIAAIDILDHKNKFS